MSNVPYTGAARPAIPSADDLRARIPGWGADLDPADRPSVPRELAVDPGGQQASPPLQDEHWPRERSIEHARQTAVFGTSCPPHGVSGAVRKLAYRRYSEGRAAHWLLLLAADRIESKGAALRSFASLRPDNPISETGVLSERSHHGLSSRLGRGRVDVVHHPIDPVLVGLPWVASGLAGYGLVRALRKSLRR